MIPNKNERLNAAIMKPQAIREGRVRDVRFYSGATVERFSFFEGRYWLKLSTDEGAADLTRLNNGAPITNGHNRAVLSDQLGVVEKAWWDAGESFATMRFSDRDEVTPIWDDIESNIIQNVSMETAVLESEESRNADKEIVVFATSWEPRVLAVVPSGADPGAQFLSDSYNEEKDIYNLGGTLYSRQFLKDLAPGGDLPVGPVTIKRNKEGLVVFESISPEQSGEKPDHRLAIEEARLRLF